MKIPIPEGKIGVFKITGGGKKRYDGLDTPRPRPNPPPKADRNF